MRRYSQENRPPVGATVLVSYQERGKTYWMSATVVSNRGAKTKVILDGGAEESRLTSTLVATRQAERLEV